MHYSSKDIEEFFVLRHWVKLVPYSLCSVALRRGGGGGVFLVCIFSGTTHSYGYFLVPSLCVDGVTNVWQFLETIELDSFLPDLSFTFNALSNTYIHTCFICLESCTINSMSTISK